MNDITNITKDESPKPAHGEPKSEQAVKFKPGQWISYIYADKHKMACVHEVISNRIWLRGGDAHAETIEEEELLRLKPIVTEEGKKACVTPLANKLLGTKFCEYKGPRL